MEDPMNASATHWETTHTFRRMSLMAAVLSGLFWVGGPNLTEAGLNVWTTAGPTGAPIHALAIDPADPRTVYAAAESAGLFKTVDGRESWTAMNALSGFFVFT